MRTMLLVDKDMHNILRHRGGVSFLREMEAAQ